MPKKLNIYASGDGSLSFVWDENGRACGKVVSMYYAEQAVKRQAERFKHFRLVDMHGPRLIPIVKRIDATRLEHGGREYMQRDGAFYVFIQDDASFHLVKNISTISALKFFLEHEREFYQP